MNLNAARIVCNELGISNFDFYQKIKTHCTEVGVSVYFSSEVNQDNNEENVVGYVNKLNPSLFLKFAFKEPGLSVNYFKGKHSLSIIGERLSNKIGLDKEITSQGKSLPILKKTKSVTLIFNGNFYQFNIEELITKIVNELKDIYKN